MPEEKNTIEENKEDLNKDKSEEKLSLIHISAPTRPY